jgi:hypothetical protein
VFYATAKEEKHYYTTQNNPGKIQVVPRNMQHKEIYL